MKNLPEDKNPSYSTRFSATLAKRFPRLSNVVQWQIPPGGAASLPPLM
jgi:hypothetical protein